MRRASTTRVKVPCNDEGDFYVRLADHIAEHGLRIPAEHPLPIGDRLRVALEFRDGGTLSGEAVVAAHVQLGSGTGLNVRFVRFDRSVAAGEQPAAAAAPPPSEPSPPPPLTPAAPSSPDREVDVPEAPPDLVEIIASPGSPGDAESGSHLPGVRWWRAVRHKRRAAAAAAAAAVALAAALGFAITRRQATPEEDAAAHIAAADRLLAAGRVTGDGGALEHLLAAKRLRGSKDSESAARLSRVASTLEALGARALDRGDLEVASIHLAAARLAAPGRASIRAKLDALAKAQRSHARRNRVAGGAVP